MLISISKRPRKKRGRKLYATDEWTLANQFPILTLEPEVAIRSGTLGKLLWLGLNISSVSVRLTKQCANRAANAQTKISKTLKTPIVVSLMSANSSDGSMSIPLRLSSWTPSIESGRTQHDLVSPDAVPIEYTIPTKTKALYLFVWFALNIALTIYNKAVLIAVRLLRIPLHDMLVLMRL